MNNFDLHYDAIKEAVSYGIGEAASNLSELVNEKILISIPEIITLADPFSIDKNGLKKSANRNLCVKQNFKGELMGQCSLFANKEKVVELLLKDSSGDLGNRYINQAILEIGNILLGTCMTCIADYVKKPVRMDLPFGDDEYPENIFKRIKLDGKDNLVIKVILSQKDADLDLEIFVLFETNLKDILNKLIK